MPPEAKPRPALEAIGGDPREARGFRSRWHQHPYALLAGAVTLGFIVGGGLATRLTRRIVGTGLRIALTAALPSIEERIARAIAGPELDTKKENDS